MGWDEAISHSVPRLVLMIAAARRSRAEAGLSRLQAAAVGSAAGWGERGAAQYRRLCRELANQVTRYD